MGWFAVEAFDTGYNTPPPMNMLVTHTESGTKSCGRPLPILIGEMSVQEIVVENTATLWCDFQISLTGEAMALAVQPATLAHG